MRKRRKVPGQGSGKLAEGDGAGRQSKCDNVALSNWNVEGGIGPKVKKKKKMWSFFRSNLHAAFRA